MDPAIIEQFLKINGPWALVGIYLLKEIVLEIRTRKVDEAAFALLTQAVTVVSQGVERNYNKLENIEACLAQLGAGRGRTTR